MKRYAVLIAIGKDRIGIVDDVSQAIFERDCNVEESRMAVLGGEFAAILLTSGSAKDVGNLIDEVPQMAKKLDLHMELRSTDAPRADLRSRPYLIESVSLDSPGIVHALTTILRKNEINIEVLETETTAAPWTGAPMFLLKARINVPERVPITSLREKIEELALEHDLDIKISPIAVSQAEI